MSRGALSQSRVREENTLFLKKDNLEDKRFVDVNHPNVTSDRGGKKGVRFGDDTMESLYDYYSDPANPTDPTDPTEEKSFLNPMFSEQSTLLKSIRSNKEGNEFTDNETLNFTDDDSDEVNEPNMSLITTATSAFDEELDNDKKESLAEFKKLDARKDKAAIIDMAISMLISTFDDDNNQRKIKDIKNEIISRWYEY